MRPKRKDSRFVNVDRPAARLFQAIAERIAALLEVDCATLPFGRKTSALIDAEVDDAYSNTIAVEWVRLIGHQPNRAERARLRRAIGRLERAGLVEIERRGPAEMRMTHLRLVEPTE
jgi:hypothetical protein